MRDFYDCYTASFFCPEPTWWNGDDRWPDYDPRGICDDRYDDPRADPDLCWHGYRLGLGCRDCAAFGRDAH
jgi:hypothetical protein